MPICRSWLQTILIEIRSSSTNSFNWSFPRLIFEAGIAVAKLFIPAIQCAFLEAFLDLLIIDVSSSLRGIRSNLEILRENAAKFAFCTNCTNKVRIIENKN